MAESEINTSNLQSEMGVTESKALSLLGAGWKPEIVANTLGVSASLISQYLAKEEFKNKVQELRFQNLQKHSDHDDRLDRMEHKLAANLEKNLAFLMKPQDQLKALETINRLKRRGEIDTNSQTSQSPVVTLLMPTFVTQRFTTNINNQVINAGGQVLETIQSSTLMKEAKKQIIEQQQALIENSQVERNSNELTSYTEIPRIVPIPESISTGNNAEDF